MSLCFLAETHVAIAAKARDTYENYAFPIRSVMNRLDADHADFELVCRLMREGHDFSYRMRHPYRAASPELTEARRSGCCKDKSLWLASRMNDDSLRYVIGRAHGGSYGMHAWLVWEWGGESWVLDCTNYSKPIRQNSLSSGDYVALYQWRKGR